MTAPTVNGRPPRKQLSEQLDRLDGIIESLADGLPEAVRHALHASMPDAEPAVGAVPTAREGNASTFGGPVVLRLIADAAAEVGRSEGVGELLRAKSAVLLGTAAGVVVAALTSSVSPFAAVLIGTSAAGVAAAIAGRRGGGSTAA